MKSIYSKKKTFSYLWKASSSKWDSGIYAGGSWPFCIEFCSDYFFFTIQSTKMKFQNLMLKRFMVPIKNHVHPPISKINNGKQSFKTPKKILGTAVRFVLSFFCNECFLNFDCQLLLLKLKCTR